MHISKKGYELTISNKGNITKLTNRFDDYNVIKQGSSSFALPFDRSTQQKERTIPLKLHNQNDTSLSFTGKNVKQNYQFYDEFFSIHTAFTRQKGPRMGINVDFSFLDTDDDTFENKLMLTDMYIDPDYLYGYFLFRQYNGQYVVMTINDRFSAYRLKYSYYGHRVLGMQILANASDVIVDDNRNMIQTDSLNVSFSLQPNLKSAEEFIAKHLNIAIASYEISGNVVGNDFSFSLIHDADDIRVLDDDHVEVPWQKKNSRYSFQLKKASMYRIITTKANRKHSSYVMGHKTWDDYYHLVCHFYQKNFQHETGAFYRVMFKNTLSPQGGRTFEGVHFGNPYEMMSCRTGEFGGFAGWAMLKYLRLHPNNDKIFQSVKKYIEHWALNLHGRKKSLYGTVHKKPHRHFLKKYSAYHLYKEINFPQYEVFLMEQLIDYYELTNSPIIFTELIAIADHFIHDHIGENGEVLYHKTDYTTVHTPVVLFVKLVKLCEKINEDELADTYRQVVANMTEHIVNRGLDFPTEGESCTEDGSVSCSALSILYYCYHIKYESHYIEMAEKMLHLHRMLELTTYDAKMYMSSIRFWETLYESNEYGPSYNAGHSWTLWSAEAKIYYALLTAEFSYLKEAYNGFITNMAKVEPNGGMPASYTPDMIPGIPHKPYLFIYEPTQLLKRDKRSYLGMKYPSNTYSTTGNYFLIKYEETFNEISGLDVKNQYLINMQVNQGVYESLGKNFNKLILEDMSGMTISLKVNSRLTIICKYIDKLIVRGASIIEKSKHAITLKPEGPTIQLLME